MIDFRKYCPNCHFHITNCECECGLHLFGDTHGYTHEDTCTSDNDCSCVKYWNSDAGLKQWKAIIEKCVTDGLIVDPNIKPI